MKRPREAACRSQAICAWTSGLRGNATAMFVPIDDALGRGRRRARTARYGSWPASAVQRPS